MNDDGWLLVLDTATNTIVVGVGRADGTLIASTAFEGRYRHSQELLPAIQQLLSDQRLRLADLAGVIVGTGPGAFTGLRVGLATAKTLAHELGRPVVGIPTSDALLAGVPGATRLWLPSGARERLLAVAGAGPVVAAGEPAEDDVAVDLQDRAPEAALARGRQAVAMLAATLARLGAARLAAGDVDDAERLVPAYAVAPRGAPIEGTEGGVAWSRDPR